MKSTTCAMLTGLSATQVAMAGPSAGVDEPNAALTERGQRAIDRWIAEGPEAFVPTQIKTCAAPFRAILAKKLPLRPADGMVDVDLGERFLRGRVDTYLAVFNDKALLAGPCRGVSNYMTLWDIDWLGWRMGHSMSMDEAVELTRREPHLMSTKSRYITQEPYVTAIKAAGIELSEPQRAPESPAQPAP